jgi:hypothetical protein
VTHAVSLVSLCPCVLQAEGFALEQRRNQVAPFARAVGQAIQTGGASVRTAYALAFGRAIAGW